jgi:hypothetical protein
MSAAHPEKVSVAYIREIGHIAYALALRCKAGEPVERLVRDARWLYQAAWAREQERSLGRS